MTTEQRTFTSTGLELGPPIPAEELTQLRAQMTQYTADRKALAAVSEELLDEHGEIYAAMYLGRLYTAESGPALIASLRAADVDPGRAFVRFLTRKPLFHSHFV